MKRNMELVRKILLEIESSEMPWLEKINPDQNYSEIEINHHLKLMIQAGLISGYFENDPNSGIGFHVWHCQLSWNGHEFLDNIKDEEIWKKTKEGASKIGGWSISVLSDIAKAIIKFEAKKRIGLDLEE